MTNSNRWENLELRRRYLREHPWDEVAPYFPQRDGNHCKIPTHTGGIWISANHSTACDPHHITGGLLGTPRWDLQTNLIALCRPVHEWAEQYSADGLCFCCYAKLGPIKTESGVIFTGSLDLKKLSEITRTDFPGYFECLENRLEFEISHAPYERVLDWMKSHAA
jgi:hypothetical protein